MKNLFIVTWWEERDDEPVDFSEEVEALTGNLAIAKTKIKYPRAKGLEAELLNYQT